MEMSLSEMVLEFLEQLERGEDIESRSNGWESGDDDDDDDDEEGLIGGGKGKQDVEFWQTQNQLLHHALEKYSATENRIQKDMEGVMRKLKSSNSNCSCSSRGSAIENCRNCLLSEITELLRQVRYNSALCKSKWPRSPEIPSGEHSYIDVVVESKNRNKNPIRFVIDLNFRAEFEMARANKEYRKLVNTLPEMFVGGAEKLRSVLKVMCESTKRCMKENKMYMAPWRKYQYMQSKWMVTPDRSVPEVSVPVPAMAVVSGSKTRTKMRRTSMLTSDLHRAVVRVA